MELSSYPHASSNAEEGYATNALARNTIDGKKDSSQYAPAWRPELGTDPWLKVDLGRGCTIDGIHIALTDCTPWKSAVAVFDDGTEMKTPFAPEGGVEGALYIGTVMFPAPKISRAVVVSLIGQDGSPKPG